jgi:hypothetical protein
MGKIKQGILGGFSGKVGSVIGASWKGINYMRSIPQHVHNPRTEGQVNQRTKFAITLRFLQPLTDFLRTGFKLYAHKESPFNSAVAYTLRNAIIEPQPDKFFVEPYKVLVSRGGLTPAANASASTDLDPLSIAITWEDNSGVSSAKSTDKALSAIRNQTKSGEAICDTAGAQRSAGTQTIVFPDDWAGDLIDVYLGFISENGKEVSNSVYLGEYSLD